MELSAVNIHTTRVKVEQWRLDHFPNYSDRRTVALV